MNPLTNPRVHDASVIFFTSDVLMVQLGALIAAPRDLQFFPNVFVLALRYAL